MEVIAIHTKRLGWIASRDEKSIATFRRHSRFGQVVELPGATMEMPQAELNKLLALHMDRLNAGEEERAPDEQVALVVAAEGQGTEPQQPTQNQLMENYPN